MLSTNKALCLINLGLLEEAEKEIDKCQTESCVIQPEIYLINGMLTIYKGYDLN
jgi:hypothetical protein